MLPLHDITEGNLKEGGVTARFNATLSGADPPVVRAASAAACSTSGKTSAHAAYALEPSAALIRCLQSGASIKVFLPGGQTLMCVEMRFPAVSSWAANRRLPPAPPA